MGSYPEHEKLSAVSNQSQMIGEFLEWLEQKNLTICAWQDSGTNGQPYRRPATEEELKDLPRYDGWGTDIRKYGVENEEYQSWGEGFIPARHGIQGLLSMYFKIDQDRLEDEKRQMLVSLQQR